MISLPMCSIEVTRTGRGIVSPRISWSRLGTICEKAFKLDCICEARDDAIVGFEDRLSGVCEVRMDRNSAAEAAPSLSSHFTRSR